MTLNLPKRKPTRLKNYDYSQNGYYFITICTHNKQKILCDIVGDVVYDIPQIKLSNYGVVVDKYNKNINLKRHNVCVEKYVVMPNHIHLIIKVDEKTNGTSQVPSPTNAIVPKFVSLYKRYCNREIGKNIFQRSFHDHIIRDKEDYIKIWNYIDTNPQKWNKDVFYCE